MENLPNLKEILACHVGLPNGSQVRAANEGSAKLDENLGLSNVLYVSGLTCNLISVSQIVDEIDCVAIFSKHMCALQDRTSKTLISAGERLFTSLILIIHYSPDTTTMFVLMYWSMWMISLFQEIIPMSLPNSSPILVSAFT